MNHPAIETVREQKLYLHKIVHATPTLSSQEGVRFAPSFKPEQIERMLRVEVTRDEISNLLRSLDYQSHEAMDHLTGKRPGPFTIEGVAYYEVAALPEPGWRVINPMRPD